MIQSKHSLIEVIGLLVCVALLLAGCGHGNIGTAASGLSVQQPSAIAPVDINPPDKVARAKGKPFRSLRRMLQGRESKTMTASSISPIFRRPMREPLAPGADSNVCYAWFSHYRGALQFIAYWTLGDTQYAKPAVENGWLAAPRSLPSFDSEGAHRSWLVRVLIDEALAMLR